MQINLGNASQNCLHQVEEKLKLRKSFKKKSDPDDLVKPNDGKIPFWEHQPEKFLNLENFNGSISSSKKPPLRTFCGPPETSMQNTKQFFCEPRIKNRVRSIFWKKKQTVPLLCKIHFEQHEKKKSQNLQKFDNPYLLRKKF